MYHKIVAVPENKLNTLSSVYKDLYSELLRDVRDTKSIQPVILTIIKDVIEKGMHKAFSDNKLIPTSTHKDHEEPKDNRKALGSLAELGPAFAKLGQNLESDKQNTSASIAAYLIAAHAYIYQKRDFFHAAASYENVASLFEKKGDNESAARFYCSSAHFFNRLESEIKNKHLELSTTEGVQNILAALTVAEELACKTNNEKLINHIEAFRLEIENKITQIEENDIEE